MTEEKKTIYPPYWADKLLEWLLPVHLLEEVQGDLHEVFYKQAGEAGLKQARKEYLLTALNYIRPYFFKRRKKHSHQVQPLYTNMLGHYFTIALRNMLRSKAFSLINILGLALGMACSLLIFLWVEDERSIDNFHTNGDKLYSIYLSTHIDGNIRGEYQVPALLPAEIKKAFPEITYSTGFATIGVQETFQAGDKIHKIWGGVAGEEFFSMFSYPLVEGTQQTALQGPNSVAISRKMAELFFGTPQKAIGKTIRHDNKSDLIVTSVFENLPAQASDRFDFLLNFQKRIDEAPFLKRWDLNTYQTYIQLAPEVNVALVEAKIKDFLDAYLKQSRTFKVELGLQRFGDKYLYSKFEQGKPTGGRIEYITIFSGVAVFVLLIACINFMNLSTARSGKRAREVGVRKVVGSTRLHLIGQFIGEAVLYVFSALLIALSVVWMVLPAFNNLTGKDIILPVWTPSFYISLLSLIIFTGFVAGSYPALFLSSLQPVKVLKGAIAGTGRGAFLRKGLVVFQFVLSILLLTATLVVTRQIEYIQTKQLGYNRENLLYMYMEGDLKTKYSLFKQEASKMPGIKAIDRSAGKPQDLAFISSEVDWEGKDPAIHPQITPNGVGYDYVHLMGLEIIKGRNFSREMATDSANYLVNEEAVKHMGMKDPIGKSFTLQGKKGQIIGVVKNYHIQSLHQPIEPLVLRLTEKLPFGFMLVRTEAGKTKEALESLQKVFKQINPNYPFNYHFVDEEYANLYKSEQVIGKLSYVFAFLAIVISCLGLLGLALFMAEQRRKEVGIRKVLGASTSNIVSMFSKDFLKPVCLSFAISLPIAYLSMSKWLENYAYQIELSPSVFALAGVITLLIALLTVIFQAIKTALANPVKSLRNE